jgi:probable rRNA maturation factor
MTPVLELYCHIEEPALDETVQDALLLALEAALPEILALPKGPDHVLSELESVEISIVDDPTIADVHGRFLDDPTATDVITFPHGDGLGEIIVSYDTALRQADQFGEPWLRELFRYMIHGLLHLHGYLDGLPEQRELMFSYQEPLVAKYAQSLPI